MSLNSHPNGLLLKKLYSDFTAGNLPAVLSVCADKMAFNVPGKSKIAGKYDKNSFATKFVPLLMELSGGTLKMEVHDILANDQHAMVILVDKLTRAGKEVEYRTVHVWRFEGGKPVAWYEYPRDLYQYDAIWGV